MSSRSHSPGFGGLRSAWFASPAMPKPLMGSNGIQDALFEPEGVPAAHGRLAKCRAKGVIEERPHEFNAGRRADAWEWLARHL